MAGEYLKKGAMVYLEGKLRNREWEDKEGNKRSTTEIAGNLLKMLDKKPIRHPVKGTELPDDIGKPLIDKINLINIRYRFYIIASCWPTLFLMILPALRNCKTFEQ